MLDRAETNRLAALALQGDADAHERIVEGNLRYVVRVAKRFAAQTPSRASLLLDMIQAGNEGLIRAARTFDPDRGTRFLTYASHWIEQAIQTWLDQHDDTVRQSPTSRSRIRRVRKLQQEAQRVRGRELTVEEVMEATGYTRESACRAMQGDASMVSMDAPRDETGRTVADIMPAPDDGDEAAHAAELSAIVDALLAGLPPRDRAIVRQLYGISVQRELTASEIASGIGISRERVRQLKDRAMSRLPVVAGASSQLRARLRDLGFEIPEPPEPDWPETDPAQRGRRWQQLALFEDV